MVQELTLGIAFVGGLLSFFSPCILPLIPAYISHLAGTTIEEIGKKKSKLLQAKVFINALFFVLSFATLFIAVGISIGFISEVFTGFNIWLGRVAGVLIIIFGLHTMGLLQIPFLRTERRLNVNVGEKKSYVKSTLLGAAFGLGWSPCIGPILASILVLAGSSASYVTGAILLGSYSLGLAIPFLLTGLFTSAISRFIAKINRYFGIVNIIAGLLLIILGIIVFTNNFSQLLALFVEVTGIRFGL